MARRDDDALSWGDDDPTLDTGIAVPDASSRDARSTLPAGFTPLGRGSDAVDEAGHEDDEESEPADRRGLSNAGLLALGVLGGVYVLFAVGWLIGGLRLQPAAGFLVAPDGNAPPLWTGGNAVALWLAVLAPPIWFGAVFWLTAHTRPWLRWVLLGTGVVLLVPWPFVMVGAVGA